MSEKIVELTNESELNSFVKEGFILIDFYANWCMPCTMMVPIFQEFSEKFKGKIKFGKVNIDEGEKLASKFNIRSIPNFILFRNGKIADQFVGGMTLENFKEKLKKHLK